MASPMNEQDWRKQADANTLAEAEAIRRDPSRMKGASEAARRMIEEQDARLAGLRKVAGRPAQQQSPPAERGRMTSFWGSR